MQQFIETQMVLAWDPDFTRVTPEEDVDWEHLSKYDS